MDERDIHRATAALLFEVSRADFQIHDDELLAIRDRLATAFPLEPGELVLSPTQNRGYMPRS